MNPIGHFKTITHHKIIVMQNCFRVGLYWQGICHDLSKYTPTEFIPGAIYYQGDRSPNNKEREETGLSKAWIHHKGRNKHHYEYWTDYSSVAKRGEMVGVIMPRKYIAEMICDRIAASKIYNKEKYEDSFPLAYLMQGVDHMMLHEQTRHELVFLLDLLRKKGEDYTFSYIRKAYLKGKKVPEIDLEQIRSEVVIPRDMSR